MARFMERWTMTTNIPEAAGNVERGARLRWYERMALIRGVELRLSQAAKAGEIPGPVHVSIGQEATAVGVTTGLRDGDWVASTHRGHGHFLALGGDPNRLVAEVYGRATGVCRGKGGSMHVADYRIGMIGANGIVGAGIGLSAGAALSCQAAGAGNVAVAFFGDGAANEGLFFETLNLSQLWKLPLVLVCENNGWSEFMASSALTAGVIADRAAPFGMPNQRVDGNDVDAVAAAAATAIARARQGNGPTLIEAVTYRTHGHVEAEATFLSRRYRPETEIEEWKGRDPLARLAGSLVAAGAGDELGVIDARVRDQVEAAFQFAEASPFPELSSAYTDVFAEPEDQ
jgi:acetoin:2,6-dichlorophenolindophenol oxidoreductase subunit alpha